ncbi:MAG: ElyC/SanA/YdcF family protein [Verrucomicrobiales bacterium]|nr:ElyC/SanA/YdcF family protein [Verrucomicrobiales bacterium]
MARKRKRSITFCLIKLPLFLLIAGVVACNLWIVISTHGRVYASAGEIEAQPVALVLGTSKNVAPDTPNRHFDNRIAAAVALFKTGKVEQLLVSGYRDSKYYDETLDMIAKLKSAGVPAEVILADNEGARTFDSVVRAKSVFGFDRFVIVSDDFHVSRALFIADELGLNAIAMKSAPVEIENSAKVRLREYFARVKAVIDLYLWTGDSGPALTLR